MEWKMISLSGMESTVDIGSINTTCTNNTVNSTISIAAHLSLDGRKYKCTTRFTEFSRSSKCAKRSLANIMWPVVSNVPEYSFTWESKILYIRNESNVLWIELKSSMSSSVSATQIAILVATMSVTPIILEACVFGCILLLIRFITRRQKAASESTFNFFFRELYPLSIILGQQI